MPRPAAAAAPSAPPSRPPPRCCPWRWAPARLRIITNAMVSRVRHRRARQGQRAWNISTRSGASAFRQGARRGAGGQRLRERAAAAQFQGSAAGLANSSGQVGRNLMDTTGTNITGHIPALENRPRYNEDGKEMAHLYIPFWLYKEQAAGKLDFPRGYHYEIGGRFGMPGARFAAGRHGRRLWPVAEGRRAALLRRAGFASPCAAR